MTSFTTKTSANGRNVYAASITIAVPLPSLPSVPPWLNKKIPQVKLPTIPPILEKVANEIKELTDLVSALTEAIPDFEISLKVKVGPATVVDTTLGPLIATIAK